MRLNKTCSGQAKRNGKSERDYREFPPHTVHSTYITVLIAPQQRPYCTTGVLIKTRFFDISTYV